MRDPSRIEIMAELGAISRIEELTVLALILILLAALLVVLGVQLESRWLLIVSQLTIGASTLFKVKIAWDELVLMCNVKRYVRHRATEMGGRDARSLKRAMRHAWSAAIGAWHIVIFMALLTPAIGIVTLVPDVGLIFTAVIPVLAMQVCIMSAAYGKLAEAIQESQRKRRIMIIQV